jgi:hypothetical protein
VIILIGGLAAVVYVLNEIWICYIKFCFYLVIYYPDRSFFDEDMLFWYAVCSDDSFSFYLFLHLAEVWKIWDDV